MSFYTHWLLYGFVAMGMVAGAALVLLILGSLWPGSLGYDIRIVESGSMRPTIPVGAVVLTRAADTYQVDDIVTYQRRGDNNATTHRLVGTTTIAGQSAFVTQGDANNVADMEPVLPAEIAGRVWLEIPYIGYLLSWVRSPWGFALVVGVPATLLVYEQFVRIRRALTKAASEDTTT